MIEGRVETGFDARFIYYRPYAAATEADANVSKLTKQCSGVGTDLLRPRMREP